MTTGKAQISAGEIRRKLAILLNWGTKCYHVQPYRPYLAVALIEHIRDIVSARIASDSRWLEPYLLSWIGQAAEVTDAESALAMEALSSELFNRAVLKFDAYLEQLIASGRTARHSSGSDSVSKHLAFCQCLQILCLPQDLATLRRNTVFGFHEDIQVSSHNREIKQAFDHYLNQSKNMRFSNDLVDCALLPIPAILLNTDDTGLFDYCRRRIDEFVSVPSSHSFDFAIRLSLFIHLLETQRYHRLLLDLLVAQWRTSSSISKPVADAIKRHRLLVSAFEEQYEDSHAALSSRSKANIFASSDGNVIIPTPDIVSQQIQDLQQHVSMIDYQTLEKLHSAQRTHHTADSISTMWIMSLEMVARLDVKVRCRVISVMADLWSAIIQVSREAWKSHLRRWVVDANPTSPTYVGTSALCLELLLRGAIKSTTAWSKLVHPFVCSPTQADLNRLYMQPTGLLCMSLLPMDCQPVASAHDLLLQSAINTDLAGLAFDEAAAVAFLGRLPAVFLILLDESSPSGISSRIRNILNSQYLRRLAMRYDGVLKESFLCAMNEIPERQAFLQLLLEALLGKSGDCE